MCATYCAALARAQEISQKLHAQDVVTWNSRITNYVQQGLPEEALTCFEQMQHSGLSPNAITFACILKACGCTRSIVKGQEMHARISKHLLLAKNIVAANTLADTYIKCGLLTKAQEVFDELHFRDVVSWNTLITAYTQQKHEKEALRCFERMQCEGLSPSKVTFACILKVCGSICALHKGEQVHVLISEEVVQEKWKFVANALLDMYVKCGLLNTAQVVFNRLPVQDVVAWTVLVGGWAQHGCGGKALMYFERMQCESCSPNTITFVCILKACGSTGALDNTTRVHAQVTVGSLFEEDNVIANALVDTYKKCGSLTKAQEVFNKLPARDLISWNALISGYAQDGCGEEALNHFEAMRHAGFSPDAFTYACILKVCGSLGAACKGQEVYADIVQDGLLEKDMVLANALVDMLAKCGMLDDAREVFDELLAWDVVSWNSLIAGYAQHGLADEAFSCFDHMQGEGFLPDMFTFASILKVCGSIGAACKGQKIHDEITRGGLLKADGILCVALVDMYAKIGMLLEAQDVFDELLVQDFAALKALLAGYAQLGEDEPIANSLKKLMECGEWPDGTLFTSALNACSHGGLLENGEMYLEIMSTNYGAILTLDQYACIIDLFGRAGHLGKAAKVIMEMPFHTSLTIWLSLLAACKKWGNAMLGECAFEHALELDEMNEAAYACMSNMFMGMQKDAFVHKIELITASRQKWKNPRLNLWTGPSRTACSLAVSYKNNVEHNIITSNLEHIDKRIARVESSSNFLHEFRDIASSYSNALTNSICLSSILVQVFLGTLYKVDDMTLCFHSVFHS